jgi:hypothetical protein
MQSKSHSGVIVGAPESRSLEWEIARIIFGNFVMHLFSNNTLKVPMWKKRGEASGAEREYT